jgi:hypothetical protein
VSLAACEPTEVVAYAPAVAVRRLALAEMGRGADGSFICLGMDPAVVGRLALLAHARAEDPPPAFLEHASELFERVYPLSTCSDSLGKEVIHAPSGARGGRMVVLGPVALDTKEEAAQIVAQSWQGVHTREVRRLQLRKGRTGWFVQASQVLPSGYR